MNDHGTPHELITDSQKNLHAMWRCSNEIQFCTRGLDRAQRGTDFNLPVRSCEYLVNLVAKRA